MQYILVLVVGWFADWLVAHVPGLDPSIARQVAQVIADAVREHFIGTIVSLVATGWYWFRRPGDVPAKSLPSAAVFHKPSDPAATAAGERK